MGDTARPSRWDIARPAVSARYVLDTARDHHVPDDTCLAGTGLRATDLDEPGALVLPEQELRVIRNLLASGGDPRELGVETGLRYSIASAGILGYALLSSPTVREAFSILERFTALTSVFFDVTYTDTAAGLLVEVDDTEVPPDVRPFLLPRDLVAGSRAASLFFSPALRDLVAGLHRPVLVELRDLATPEEIAFAQVFLSAYDVLITIESGAPRNAFTVPRELLDQPTPAPEPATAATCIQQCERLLDERYRFTGTAAQIRHLLLRDPARMPTLAEAARGLGLSDRTLHRRLAADGTTFRTLLDQVRESIAVELLAEGLTVEAVSRRLGYSDTAAFSHAYRRWRGHAPSHRT
ncbi:AraC family transcriptional regulator ligand-binding domain-containing protein [Nocardia sp. NPDC051030]|uniref:AraC family transcriptional regulator n=1 Tax=Nocardia sp. NPDC051030 TaxID=3155162 RepID=UPI0034172EDC